MGEEGAEAFLPPEHGGEEAAEEEEERHAEAMDGFEEQMESGAGVGVLDGPWTAGEGEGRVESDAEEHGDGAQGIEVVAAGGEGRRRHGVETGLCAARLTDGIF